MKKTVIKVDINCQICKTEVLKAVTKLTGIDQVSVDAEKGTLTVVGEVDPVSVIKQLRKVKKTANIISVGPPKPPEPQKPKPKPKPPVSPPLPPSCNQCKFVVVRDDTCDSRVCNIL